MGPLAKLHFNSGPMMALDDTCSYFSRGGGGGGVLDPLSPPLDPHMIRMLMVIMCDPMSPIVRKPDFVACEQQRRRPVCKSTV